MFARTDASLFRSLTTLGQKAGVPRARLASLVLKELTDNALDAGAKVKVGRLAGGDWYYVDDDGPGIEGDDREIASLFSFGRPLTSSKLFRLPTRGALGNGLRVVAGAVCASQGGLRVCTRGRWLTLTPQDDGTTTVHRGAADNRVGTRVEVRLGADLASSNDALASAKLAVAFIGDSRYQGKTSPFWYGEEDFFELLMAASGSVDELFDGAMDGYKSTNFFGTAKTTALSRVEAKTLLTDLRRVSREVKPEKLGSVGEFGDQIGYGKAKGYFELPDARGLRARLPAVVEAWVVEKLDKDAAPETTLLVNRTPITAEMQCWVKKAETVFYGCGLSHRVKTGRQPFKYIINVQTPYMPITTDGKEPNLKPLVGEIGEAIRKAALKARKATADGRPSASKKDVVIAVLREAIARASGNGRHRFSLRQLYYKVRPLFEEKTGANDLDYNHFAAIVTGYESEILGKDIPGMYRDARGTLYHPHTGETIPLGTLNVEAYKRPEWTFNKILYCEKEGFFPLLLDEKWAERHDCALLTSKGFASRAARDVIDLLGDSDEELLFFAIHDADGPGTKILEALQEATKARPARRVQIVDLGLNPWEALKMRLEVETFERKGGRVPVADYVRKYRGDNTASRVTDWEDWLQSKRVELNAMSSPEFLTWLDQKMEIHTQGKVIPPNDVLGEKLIEATKKEVRELVVARILKEQGAEKQIKAACANAPDIAPHELRALRARLAGELEDAPTELWTAPLSRVAVEHAAEAVDAKDWSKS